MESSDTSKQIDELELRFAFVVLDNFFTRHFSLRVESERVHSRGSGSSRFAWPGCGQKERAGSRLTPRLKARHFQKNTIHPQNPERIQYAQGTLRPCNPRAMASYCLILVAESVEVPSRGQELNSASLPPFYINPVIFGYKKGVELNAFTYLRPSTARNE